MRKFDKIARKKLGELLVDAGLITYEAVDDAIAEQKRTGRLVGEILVDMGLVKERDIAVVLARQFQLPFISLADYRLNREIVATVPPALCHQFGIIPLDLFGEVLIVAVSQNPTKEAVEAINEATGCHISPFVAVGSEVQRYLDELAPYDPKAVAAERKAEAAAAAGGTWTDVFDKGDESATGEGSVGGKPKVKKPTPKRKPKAPAEQESSALAIFDIGDQRVTQRLEKPKE